eukprot:77140_1
MLNQIHVVHGLHQMILLHQQVYQLLHLQMYQQVSPQCHQIHRQICQQISQVYHHSHGTPTKIPTNVPTSTTNIPTGIPTHPPTNIPTSTTNVPSGTPTKIPTNVPTSTTNIPTSIPTHPPTNIPTCSPTSTTNVPSAAPTKTTINPTNIPTASPTLYTINPSVVPTLSPTKNPITPVASLTCSNLITTKGIYCNNFTTNSSLNGYNINGDAKIINNYLQLSGSIDAEINLDGTKSNLGIGLNTLIPSNNNTKLIFQYTCNNTNVNEIQFYGFDIPVNIFYKLNSECNKANFIQFAMINVVETVYINNFVLEYDTSNTIYSPATGYDFSAVNATVEVKVDGHWTNCP